MRARSSRGLLPGTPLSLEASLRIERLRLECRVRAPTASPITVLTGAAGVGKSELLRSFRNDSEAFYFRAGSKCATLARLVQGLAQTVAPVAPGAQASFPRAWERASQSWSPGSVLAHWLCEHLRGVDHPLAIDDLHDAAADPSIAAFIAKLGELRSDASLTIAVRSVGALPVALWMATGRMERPIEEADLRFDASEAAAFARMLGLELSPEKLAALLGATRGSTAAVAYALTQLARDPRAFSRAPIPATFEEIAAAVFAHRNGHERELLLAAALYPTIDDLLVEAGWTDAFELRSAMPEDAPFMWELDAAGCLRFHDRFRDYLQAQFACCDLDFRSRTTNRAVESLRRAGRYADALALATRNGLTDAMAELLDEHGFAILESGEVDVIGQAIDACGACERSLGAKVLALRGYQDARRGRLDTGEAYFRLALETAPDETSRVAIALYYTRELAVQRRQDACEVLAPFADSTTLPRAVLIDVRSSFAQGLAAANRLDEARSRTEEVFAMLDAQLPAALRARVFARGAYVALESGELALARTRASIAAPIAIAESLYDVAASTYTVLYNIAYGDDDAVSCLEYLRRVRDLGMKSGTLRFDVYALLGMYELYAEAGDEATLAELERELAAVDKHDSGVEIMEALLPAKALEAAWAGDFEAAAHVLRPTAEHYATPERRALCWAQMGVYWAARGDAERSLEAVRLAQSTLQEVDVRTTLFELTLLTLGLARWAAGDVGGAWDWVNAADRASTGNAPRLRAFRAAIGALIAGPLDLAGSASGLRDALAELRAASFGGMARLIEALPCGRGSAADEVQTTGLLLAKDELPGHFAEALKRGNAASLCAWLDALPPTVVRELGIVKAFDRWADRRPGLIPDANAVVDLRRSVAVYQPPVRTANRLVDDVDAAIAALVEQLDIASPLMAEHSRAVSAWCSRIARALGLSEAQSALVRRSGLLHDIGKLRTPSHILNAPRSLNTAEWSIMKDHAAAGALLVAEVADLRPFIAIVRAHHERLDGTGYPDGLRLGAIPLAARIVSVADAFNAMIGRRPYRPPMSPAAALSELERKRETQFDPEVVAAMIRVVNGWPAPDGQS